MKLASGLCLCLLVGCAAEPRRIAVPRHLGSGASRPASPYVVKLAEGQRAWAIELPATAAAYEVRVPIGDGTPLVPAGSPAVGERGGPAYLEAMARVQALYARKSYDLALLELKKLMAVHPDDPKLLSMEGTLHYKLGDRARAHEAWERVARLEPENEAVLEMLEAAP